MDDEALLTDDGLADELTKALLSGLTVWPHREKVLALLRRARAARLAALADGGRMAEIAERRDRLDLKTVRPATIYAEDFIEHSLKDIPFLLNALLAAHHALQARACDEPALEAAAIVGEARGRKEALAGAKESICPVAASQRRYTCDPNCEFCQGSGWVLMLSAPAKEGT